MRRRLVCCLLLLSPAPILGVGRVLSGRAQALLNGYIGSKASCPNVTMPDGKADKRKGPPSNSGASLPSSQEPAMLSFAFSSQDPTSNLGAAVLIQLNALAESAVSGTSWTPSRNFVRNIEAKVDNRYIEYAVQFAYVNFPAVALDMGESSLYNLRSLYVLGSEYRAALLTGLAYRAGREMFQSRQTNIVAPAQWSARDPFVALELDDQPKNPWSPGSAVEAKVLLAVLHDDPLVAQPPPPHL